MDRISFERERGGWSMTKWEHREKDCGWTPSPGDIILQRDGNSYVCPKCKKEIVLREKCPDIEKSGKN